MRLVSECMRTWRERVIAEHDRDRPFAPENGSALRFAPGDLVVWSSDEGVERQFRVLALYQPTWPCSRYALGCRYLLEWDSPWYPVEEWRLRAAEVSS